MKTTPPGVPSATEPKHTPGPWITQTFDNGMDGKVEVVDSATEGTVIAALRCRSVRMGIKVNDRSEEFAANARLIAASPDLLAALTACLPDLKHYAATHGPGPDRRLADAIAAIARATS